MAIKEVAGADNLEKLNFSTDAVSATVTDDADVTTFTISTANVSEADGGTVTFTVQASNAPQGEATV